MTDCSWRGIYATTVEDTAPSALLGPNVPFLPRSPPLLHLPRPTVLQAFINDRLHLVICFARQAALLMAQFALLAAQLSLLAPQFALLAAQLTLPGADLALEPAQLSLQFADPALHFRQLLHGDGSVLLGLELGDGGIQIRHLMGNIRGRNAGLLLASAQFCLLPPQFRLLPPQLFLLSAQVFHGLVHLLDLGNGLRIIDHIRLAVTREPQEVPMRHGAGLVDFAVVPIAGETGVLTLPAHQRIRIAIVGIGVAVSTVSGNVCSAAG